MAVGKIVVLRLLGEILLTGVMFVSPLFLFAQTDALSGALPDPSPPSNNDLPANPWWKGIAVNGFASLSYTYNTNDPIPPLNQFRVFDFNDNEPQLDVAQIVIQHPVAESGEVGFRVNAIAGSGVPPVTASYGMFRNSATGVGQHYDLPEFYLSYIAPLGKGLRFDLGKFATPLGYEVIGGYDGYNDNFSRGYIFGYGLPFTHTGLKTSYQFSSKFSGALLFTNGCDAVTRLNGGVTITAEFLAATSRTTNVTFNFMHGPEKPHNDHDQRSLYEIVVSWKVIPQLMVALDGLYADEDHAANDGSDAIWKGLAVYPKYNFTRQFSLAFRAEIFGDDGGSRTGTSQTLHTFTLTPEYVLPIKISRLRSEFRHFEGKFVMRGELRQDFSDHTTFSKGTGFTSRQFTTAFNLIYLF